ncbi:terminase large subunit [Blastococcus xanthinilyticus]|uniref:Phage terminase large subunit-like protein n=1 Tax=Blastococcus xanthinilyticus TaxID=1564164 RepID=A0A5S5CMB4_9ACTN|nr:terminase TerL endonuclease subunit [Blastococcus xanthinilyticus]TYP82062.1 phage terminase large subunit-like protein [Blastococcus xanthinilyticus]
MARRTRTPSPAADDVELPDAEELERLKLSPEVAWYLVSRGIPLPDCPPAIKTPEPGELGTPGVRFDPERVDRVLKAFGLLRHTKGKWAGQPLKPDPWQVAYVLAPVFGWVRFDEDAGRWVRVIRELYVDIPRKNGKSTTLGGIAVYMTAADGESGAEVIAAATTTEQAGFVFAPVKALVENAPALSKHLRAYAKRIVHPATASYFQAISSVADAQHGANIHCAVIDELHVHKSADMVETLETGTGSRDQPLVATITTADDGRPNTIYARKRKRIEQLAARVITDATVFGVVWAASKDDDPFVEATWRKANPGFGISPTRSFLAKEAAKAKDSPADLAKFLRLHLGIRTKQETKYLELGAWDDTAGMVDESKLVGRPCHGGLDLASVNDITALCWDFGDGDRHEVLWRFWIPEARMDDLDKRTAGEATVWKRNGILMTTPGNVIDNDFIVDTVLKDAERFEVRTIGFDRWGATDVVRRLGEEGLTCVPVGQGFASTSAPMKEILRLVLSRRYVHGGNPVMRWMVDNLAVRMDPAGNVKPDKDRSADKIDGVSAAVVAMKEHMDAGEAEDPVDSSVFVFGRGSR